MNTIRPSILTLLFVTILGTALTACDSTEPDNDGAGEEELITSVVLTLQGGGETFTAEASDPDGDGTNFQIETLTIPSGRSYTGSIEVRDDVNDENITEEIEEEADEHQFFFEPGGADASRITVTVTDTDDNDLPVGLAFSVIVSGDEPGDATLRVILSHFDDEPKDGVTRSDETDIDVTFPVEIQ